MTPSPCRTYLEERLQSARGLGWAVTLADAAAPRAASAPTRKPVAGDAGRGLFPLLRWLGLATR